MAENLIERYLTDLGEIRGTRANVPETSFYPALERLLTEIGKTLSPKVRCVINLANRGAGLPDGGLFSADQFRRQSRGPDAEKDLFLVQTPSRGVIEAKAPDDTVDRIAGTEQVERYWKRYGMVLVTNFRAFALIGKDVSGQPRILESFALSDTEAEFWKLTAHPRKAALEQGERMQEYLKRVLLHNAPLSAPQDVAAILASYARDARLRIEQADLPALTSLREALEDALGLQFEGEKGEHFFRSTLIQTLFYGVFSAWVLWARRHATTPATKSDFAHTLREGAVPYNVTGAFDWKSAHWLLRVPMLRALFVQVADPARLGALGLIEVLDWTAAALNRVEHAGFFKSFDEGHAVQYFYEPFLHAFDPELRKELGVWYTPEEIVRYQVERVDAVLRSELGLADGLADPQVVVLDPCCGTGAYLRAVLRRIAVTLHEKGGDALVAHDLKHAAMERVFGFEILPAPFVIAHLQIGLELETLGAPLSDRTDPPERAGIFLTNALTGWEPPKEKPKQIAFPGFDAERDAAGKVKQEKPILVILGNPPYNAFAGISPEEENGLVEPYKKGLNTEWGIKKFNLDDLYIRFFRLAEKRIAEHGGRGVVSFISNFSYLGDPSFVVARRRFLDEFDAIWLDCMNGDSRETGKMTPEGLPDPSVFSTDWNREGIRVGTAIGLLVKRGHAAKKKQVVYYRDFWGVNKRADLLDSLTARKFDAKYEVATPRKDNRWTFRPSADKGNYGGWPKITDICTKGPYQGLAEDRRKDLIDIDEQVLVQRMITYFSRNVSWHELVANGGALTNDYVDFNAFQARDKVLATEGFNKSMVRRYSMRPFDQQWAYYTAVRPIWRRSRPELFAHAQARNWFVVSRFNASKGNEGCPIAFCSGLCDYHFIAPNAGAIPVLLFHGNEKVFAKTAETQATLPGIADPQIFTISANLSATARVYLAALGLPDPDADQETAELIWHHALAVGYSPAYLAGNADGIRQDWPRIPLPKSADALIASAVLGRQIAALLDTETPVPGVTAGKIRDELKPVGVFQRVDGKPAKPDNGDLDLTAGWGHGGKGGVTMPGRGRLEGTGGALSESVSEGSVQKRNPDAAYDVYLNEIACWRNVPAAVWEYTIGGYQVIKKWLSYREKPLLGRGLTPEEVRYVTEMTRRLASLIALQSALDANYQSVSKTTYEWKS